METRSVRIGDVVWGAEAKAVWLFRQMDDAGRRRMLDLAREMADERPNSTTEQANAKSNADSIAHVDALS